MIPTISPDTERMNKEADGPRGHYARHPQVSLDLRLFLGWLGLFFVPFVHFNKSQENTIQH